MVVHIREGCSVLINSLRVRSNGVELIALDYGGNESQDILLLHGLAGRGSEWENTAEWLIQYGRVIALDQRGHGSSRTNVTDFSRSAYVQDAIETIEQHCTQPIVLVGQSMGGLNAFLVAAKRPDLVKALVVVEATPERNRNAQHDIQNWLDNWPAPFQNLDDAKEFFGGDTLYSRTFAKSLEKRKDGYWPAFNKEDMIHSLDDVVSKDYWDEWKKIECPTLVVAGERSSITKPLLEKMISSIPKGQYVYIPEAGHDLHLERPDEWGKALEDFLNTLKYD